MMSMTSQTLFVLLCFILLLCLEANVYQDAEHTSREWRSSSHKKATENSHPKGDKSCGSRYHYNDDGSVDVDLRFNNVHLNKDDMYMCTAIKVPYNDEGSFITKFIPHASMTSSHHMLVYGCSLPGRINDAVWKCGGMMDICVGRPQKILYAWARDAPALTLPQNIGYSIGGKSKMKYLVVQMHFAHKTPPGEHFCPGLSMVATQQRQKYYAGVFLLGAASINIPPYSPFTKVDVSCSNPSPSALNVFAFRTHAHDLAKVITGYRVRNGNVTMIGKGNPQWPHAFYPRVGGLIQLLPGDGLLARCTYQSKRSKATFAGMGGGDEMCNFYMMYYSNVPPKSSLSCWGNQVPGSSQLFPTSANEPAPYPGFAGQASIDAVTSGKAEIPKVPGSHHHHHDVEPPAPSPNLPTPKIVTIPPTELGRKPAPPALMADLHWPDASHSPVIGQVGGVAVDKDGHVHVFHRAYRRWGGDSFIAFTDDFAYPYSPITNHTMSVLDPRDGALVHSWGGNMFFMPHGVTVDADGNLWLTDVAMHQVFKFPLYGGETPLLTLGVRMKPGSDKKHFCKPTDVAVDSEGAVYVSDGYCNGRVMKFRPDGEFITSWGERGSASREGPPPPFHFDIVHSIAITGPDEVCAADRENGRVQCFTLEGAFRRVIEHPRQMGGNVYAIAYSASYGGVLYAVNGAHSAGVRTAGFTMRSETGALLGEWTPSPHLDLDRPHDVAVSPDGKQVYVGQLTARRIYKFNVVIDGESPQKNDVRTDDNRHGNEERPHDNEGMEDNGSRHEADNIRDGSEGVTPTNSHHSNLKDKARSNTTRGYHVSAVVDMTSDVETNTSLSILFIIALVTAPVVVMAIGCVIVRSRKRRLRKYQDLLSHDDFEVYEDKKPEKKFNIGTFLTQSKQEKKGFSPLKNEISDDDVADSEDELYSNVMRQKQ